MRKRAFWGAAALLLALAAGCAAPQEEAGGGLKLWFPAQPAQEGRELAAALDTCPYEGEEASIPGLLSALLAGPASEEAGLAHVFPPGTRVLGWSLENGVASVELSAAYGQLMGMDLTVADYCVTLTLTQLPGVNGVRIAANGGGQADREGRVLYPQDVLFSGAEEPPEGQQANH